MRRLGENNRLQCVHGHNCPQILERPDGNFAVVGLDITDEAIRDMPPGPGVGSKERIILVPRAVFIAARAELPAA